jgi:predicted RNA binding protein YcfA (HicA-like mRNA interferase family)
LIDGRKCVNVCASKLSVFETATAKVIARLKREGWDEVGGAKHTKFRKAGVGTIMVPRHKTLTPGVAASIAKAAGWTK